LGMQRAAGLFGSLIVSLPPNKKEPFTYDAELSILLTDWWHKSIYEQQLGLNSIPFQFVGEPQVKLHANPPSLQLLVSASQLLVHRCVLVLFICIDMVSIDSEWIWVFTGL